MNSPTYEAALEDQTIVIKTADGEVVMRAVGGRLEIHLPGKEKKILEIGEIAELFVHPAKELLRKMQQVQEVVYGASSVEVPLVEIQVNDAEIARLIGKLSDSIPQKTPPPTRGMRRAQLASRRGEDTSHYTPSTRNQGGYTRRQPRGKSRR